MPSMIQVASLALAASASVNAQVISDPTAFLASLGPAPAGDPRFTNFHPPGPGDVRSPCPGLNTLANHGFLHHDGKNMTLPHLLEGLAAGMNMGPDFTIAVGGAGFLSSNDPQSGAFDLDDLDEHNFPIEHDSSLSRQDAFLGNNTVFYQPNWNQVLSYFGNDEYTSLSTASHAKYSRVQDSEKRNPQFTYGFREFIFSYGETAIYLQTMGSPSANGVAKVSYVKSLFEQEKLPYELGWRPSAEPITLTSLGMQVLQLFQAGPEPVPEGANVTADSYKDVFEAVAGGSKFLAALTNGLSTDVGL